MRGRRAYDTRDGEHTGEQSFLGLHEMVSFLNGGLEDWIG